MLRKYDHQGYRIGDQQACPAEAVLELASERWKLLVIFWLLKGEHGYRRDHGEIPPRVDYRLTPLGASLAPILQAMERWTIRNNLASPKRYRRGKARRSTEQALRKSAHPT
jgi:DNA-binding HxlR family transcriptional regulator